MQSNNNIANLLENTLNPSLIHQSSQKLLSCRQNQGFITQLLIISDNNQFNISIRQSALIYVKNALLDFFQGKINLPKNDYEVVKSSILQALIRNCGQRALTPTIREIIFSVAQKEFPGNWDIIQEIANNIANSEDFNEIYGSVQALKALISAFGKSINQKITVSNLCNKIVFPLLSLSSKLFQNYNDTTSLILISIFKIFSTITYFIIPQIIWNNLHSLMIFMKKILDLNIESTNIDKNMYQLKKICLRILFRFYQRHMNKKYSDFDLGKINDFHGKYTNGIVESLLFQIMNEAKISKNNSKNKRYFDLTRFSLSCLSYVYEQNYNSAMMIDRCRDKIIYLCLDRYRLKLDKNYSSFSDFTSKICEQRDHLCQFIISIIKNQTIRVQEQARKNSNINTTEPLARILGSLVDHTQKGDQQIKQICLYIFSQIASLLPEIDENIESKMIPFILKYVKPILNKEQTPILLKLRCCEIIAKYSYVQIPQNQLQQIAQGVYGCLVNNSNNPQSGDLITFLQIHAVHAFNSLLRYQFIVNFTSSYLSNILQVYTSLLEIQVSIIKCLQDMLDRFENYLQPFGSGLVEMLANTYFKYINLINQHNNNPSMQANVYIPYKKNKNNNQYINQYNEQQDDQQDENSSDEEDKQSIQNNYILSSKACLGAIRQIIQAPSFQIQNQGLIHNVLISIFCDKEESFTQEGFNILNLVLFKLKQVRPQYNIYFILITNGILPVSSQLVQNLRKQNSDYSKTLLTMLECICQQPDNDFIENTIGCLRNFISKYNYNLRNINDQAGRSFLSLIIIIVKSIHQNMFQQDQNNITTTQSQRSMILTLYMSLIQWKSLDQNQLINILEEISRWMNVQESLMKQNNQYKPIYYPIYLQVILLSIHFYPEITLKFMNADWVVTQIISHWDRFTCDYEILRVLIGIGDILSYNCIKNLNITQTLMNLLPDLMEKQCHIRLNQDQNDVTSIDDQAEEDKLFGMDQNTHIMGWKQNPLAQNQNNNNQNNHNNNDMEDQDQSQQDDLDQQFNKYYQSPLDNIDQIQFIIEILKNTTSQGYLSLMSNQNQNKLSQIINNAPNKFENNNNNNN